VGVQGEEGCCFFVCFCFCFSQMDDNVTLRRYIYIYIRMYTIRLVFNRKMVHFTSGSYFGPCEKTILFCQNNGNTEMLNKCPRDNDPTKQQNTIYIRM
jgi:hypothetical protein